jgi:hypothetical protein
VQLPEELIQYYTVKFEQGLLYKWVDASYREYKFLSDRQIIKPGSLIFLNIRYNIWSYLIKEVREPFKNVLEFIKLATIAGQISLCDEYLEN